MSDYTLQPETGSVNALNDMPHSRQQWPAKFGLVVILLFFGLLAVYWNHFHNAFAFDDFHAIVNNPAVRNLSYVPRYYSDATTFSVNPANQMYRPFLSTTFAVDYSLARKADPFPFHIQSFLWYVALLAAMFGLFLRMLRRDPSDRMAPILSLAGVAFFAFHPVSAETVNYIVQRGDILSTLGVVLGLWLYIAFPAGRAYGVYLLPVLIGCLSKQSTIVFAPIFFLYILMFEASASVSWKERLFFSLRRSVPALLLCGLFYLYQRSMAPSSFTMGGSSWNLYLLTQPHVLLYYVASMAVPLWLSADTDWSVVTGPNDPRVVLGLAFLGVLVYVIWKTGRQPETRLIAFGLLWFLIAHAPTSLLPWAEVMNDHRMFFPAVGLTLALTQALQWSLERYRLPVRQPVVAVAGILALIPFALGTIARNKVWSSDETLWRDVTLKSPNNGRGLMNYGLSQMSRGRYAVALDCFDRALKLVPNYSILAINRGIALAALGRPVEAEQEFKRAQALAPRSPEPNYYYARWLRQVNRSQEAEALLADNLRRFPNYLHAHYQMIALLQTSQRWEEAKRVASEVMSRYPDDAVAQAALKSQETLQERVGEMESRIAVEPTHDNYLSLSLAYYRVARYADSLKAAQRARDLNPKSAKAWNNIGAAAAALGQWKEAVEADKRAVALDPHFILAQNNLKYALSMLKGKDKGTP